MGRSWTGKDLKGEILTARMEDLRWWGGGGTSMGNVGKDKGAGGAENGSEGKDRSR